MTGLTPLEGDQAQDDGHLQGEGALQGECLPPPGTEEADPLWGGKVPFETAENVTPWKLKGNISCEEWVLSEIPCLSHTVRHTIWVT